MGGSVFIGDELTATGFRLTGVETLHAGAGRRGRGIRRQPPARFAGDRHRRNCAPPSGRDARGRAAGAERPPVSIIPDALGRVEPAPLGRRMRTVLGIES